MVKDTVPPLVALIAKHAPDDPDSVWNAILGAVNETASEDGTVTFSNLVLLAIGRAYIILGGGRTRSLRLEHARRKPVAAG